MEIHSNSGWHVANTATNVAKLILHRLFGDYPHTMEIKLWNGESMRIGNGQPVFSLSMRHPEVLRDLVLFHDPIRLAEAYFGEKIDVEGDFDAAVNLRHHLENLKLPLLEKTHLVIHALKLGISRVLTKPPASHIDRKSSNSLATIAFHYDVSNSFYRLWLDERMVYSCAYFESPEQTLEQAQRNKLDHICRKLRLQPGENLLDVGCGWGALVCWAAKHYGVKAHGITLSKNQYEYASALVAQEGLASQVKIELLDYRQLPLSAQYDKVSSVGMFEHVGLKNLPLYFSTIRRVLKPHGIFMNHGITSDEPDWSSGVSTRFINRHVFPDGELDTISNILRVMEDNKFEIFDVEGLRPHYALTLRHWIQRLERNREEAIRLVGERIYRIWRLYMTASALQFEQGNTGVYQIVATPKHNGLPPLPLTRCDLYRHE